MHDMDTSVVPKQNRSQRFIVCFAHSFGLVENETVEDNMARPSWRRRELEGGEFR